MYTDLFFIVLESLGFERKKDKVWFFCKKNTLENKRVSLD